MKQLHKKNLFCWSVFDEDRNIDFHSYLWVREGGNVVFDPLPMSLHDKNHLASLGPVTHIVISNSDHVRDAVALAKTTGAEIYGPIGECDDFPVQCSTWLDEASDAIEGLLVVRLSGSKTNGELAFVIEGHTLITGDLVRAHAGGVLCLLPDGKLKDKEQAIASVRRLAELNALEAVLPGDGWPVFRGGQAALQTLVASLMD